MDLRNQRPGDTFQYIVTTDRTNLYDGSGSILTNLNITSITSSRVTESIILTTQITASSILVSGNIISTALTGSLFGTASVVTSASWANTFPAASNSFVACPPYYNITCWGDSLTEGRQTGAGTPYPLSLSLDLNGRPVFNGGVGGTTAAAIAAALTASFVTMAGATTIIWAGRNDDKTLGQYPVGSITQSINAMVSALGANHQYLLLSILNTDGEGTGSITYQAITSSNKWMQTTYPNNYYDIRSYLVSQYNTGSGSDIANFNADIVPLSLRIGVSNIHLNGSGNALVAHQVAAFISGTLDQQTGSILSGSVLLNGGALTTANLLTLSEYSYPIGTVVPNVGNFTTINTTQNAQIGGLNNGLPSTSSVQIGYNQDGNNINLGAVIIGDTAGASSATATNAVIIGSFAAQRTILSSQAVIIGLNAAQNTTSASGATIIGAGAGSSAVTASSAIIIGLNSGQNVNDGTNAVIVGISAGQNSTTATNTVIIGPNAGTNATTASSAVIIGSSAGQNATAAGSSVLIGISAGTSAKTATNAVIIGPNAGQNAATASNAVMIGSGAGASAVAGGSSVIIGINAGNSATTATSATLIGSGAGQSAVTASSATIIGVTAGQSATNAGSATMIGINAGQNATSAANATLIGSNAGRNATTATTATMIGNSAGQTAVTASNATLIGSGAGSSATTATSAVMIGVNAGNTATSAASSVLIGTSAGQSATTASNAILIGASAGQSATNATTAVIIGSAAGQNSTSTVNAVIIGGAAGKNSNVATTAVLVGSSAGLNSTTASNCTYIGANADAVSGSNHQESIALGFNAKVSGSNQCAIGGTGADAVKVTIGGNTAVNTLDVVGNISCSIITASVFAPQFIQMPFSSSTQNLTPTSRTGSMYFLTSAGTNLLFIYTGTAWASHSLV